MKDRRKREREREGGKEEGREENQPYPQINHRVIAGELVLKAYNPYPNL